MKRLIANPRLLKNYVYGVFAVIDLM